MSRQPSPGPSHTQPPPALSSRTKSKAPHPMGFTAGAEDVKYQAKYKELKIKVKEIEADNDKLHFKVLNAKRNIQRMKLERAILYERLAQTPPSPVFNDQLSHPGLHGGHGLTMPHTSAPQPPTNHRGDVAGMDPDPNFIEYTRPHSRVAPGHALPAIDTSVHSPAHNIPSMQSSRRSSAGHLPPLPQFAPMLDPPRSPRSRSHHDSHERTRSQSSTHSRNLPPQPSPYRLHPQQYDNLPPMQHVLHSPSLSDRERDGPRARRHELHELAGMHDAHARANEHSMAPHSPRTHSTDTRSTSRIHNHQRIGPGTYINRDDSRSRDRDYEREREWEQEHDLREREVNYSNTRQRERELAMHSPQAVHRPRPPSAMDYPDHHIPSSRAREEYYHEPASGPSGGGGSGVYSRLSRSGTPGSGSGSGSASASGGAIEGPSRPSSRGPYYEDHSRPYRLRPVNSGPPTGEEPIDFVQEDGRSQSRDRSSASGSGGFPPPPKLRESDDSRRDRESDTRKRNRSDMDVDADMEEAPSGPGGMSYAGGISDERERGVKRYHRGSGDDMEDA